MMKTKVEIKVGDIVKLKTVFEYKEAGDEVTELVEMFAGQYVRVLGIEEELNEFGERTYLVEDINTNNGHVTVTDHEIVELYSKVEL